MREDRYPRQATIRIQDDDVNLDARLLVLSSQITLSCLGATQTKRLTQVVSRACSSSSMRDTSRRRRMFLLLSFAGADGAPLQ